MANYLGEAMKQTIKTLMQQGWSNRRIARELSINRKTVGRYKKEFTTSENGPNPPPGTTGPESLCEPFRKTITEKLDKFGLSAQRIYQDLVSEEGFTGSYDSVKRYVRKLRETTPVPFRRMETLPGEEVQVDFGSGAAVINEGKRRKTHLFRIVLGNSRKGYSESVYNQTTENFIRCLENAFRYYGGVPKTIVTDNLKAAVIKADWFDPELNPKIRDFCKHYNTIVLPTKPRIPRHKGKVEKSVDYVQENALKGRTFSSLSEQNKFLLDWEKKVADNRIHGTTRIQVSKAFKGEKPHLQELPPTLFPCFEEGERKVHRDGHVEVKGAYYSVPYEYCRSTVWVRFDLRTVRIFSRRFQQIAIHARKEKGHFSTQRGHIPNEKISAVERGPKWMMQKVSLIGSHAEAWARAMLKNRKLEGLRVLHGLLNLAGKHTAKAINKGCQKALEHEVFHLKQLKFLIESTDEDEQGVFDFMEEHPLIRQISEYASFVPKFQNDCSTTKLPTVLPTKLRRTEMVHSRFIDKNIDNFGIIRDKI